MISYYPFILLGNYLNRKLGGCETQKIKRCTSFRSGSSCFIGQLKANVGWLERLNLYVSASNTGPECIFILRPVTPFSLKSCKCYFSTCFKFDYSCFSIFVFFEVSLITTNIISLNISLSYMSFLYALNINDLIKSFLKKSKYCRTVVVHPFSPSSWRGVESLSLRLA